MENNFDKYFKEKFENREFEMKPEYWEGAEALIEADERSGWWRRFMLFFVVAILVGAVGFFTWQKNNSITSSNVERNPDFNQIEKIQEGKNNNEVSGKNLNTTNSNNKSDFNENSLSSISNNNYETVNNKEKKKETPINQNQNVNQYQKSNNSIDDLGETKSSVINSFAQTLPSKITTSKKRDPNSDSTNSTEGSGNIPSSNSDLVNSIPLVENVTDDEKNDMPSFDEKVNQEIQESILDPNKKDTTKEKEEKVKDLQKQEIAFISPLDIFLLTNKNQEFNVKPECFPYKTKVFRFGVTGGVVGYPLIENSSEDPFIGFKGGLFAEHNLKTNIFRNKWSIGTELLYHYRSGNFVATREEAVVQYSFGRTSSNAKLTPKNLHYLEMPVYLKYHLKKVSFEGGALVSYLLGARGEVNQNDNIEKGWVDELGFNKIHTNAILGFQFSLKQNLKFGVRANYSLNSILDKNAILPNGDALRESGPLYITFKFSQYLK